MAKTLRYPNGLILKGTHSRVSLLRGLKRNNTGAMSTGAAPNPAGAKVFTGTVPARSISFTMGLTGTTGACGRNWLSGKFYAIGTGTPAKLKVYAKTVGGTKLVKSASAAATKTTTTTSALIPILAPGTLVLKGTVANKCVTLKYATLKVNGVTTEMM